MTNCAGRFHSPPCNMTRKDNNYEHTKRIHEPSNIWNIELCCFYSMGFTNTFIFKMVHPKSNTCTKVYVSSM